MSYSIVAIASNPVATGHGKERTQQEAFRRVDFRRIYQDGDKQWVIVVDFKSFFDTRLIPAKELRKKYPTMISIPRTFLAEVIQLSKSHRPSSGWVTEDNQQEFFGVVSLEDYLKVRYPAETKAEAWPVEFNDHAGIFGHDTEITDPRLKIKDQVTLIDGW